MKKEEVHSIHEKRLDDNIITKQLDFTNELKLSSWDKHKAVQYLHRGGLTFFKPIFWPWLNTLELKIVEQLNHKSCRQYGDKLFDIANTFQPNFAP